MSYFHLIDAYAKLDDSVFTWKFRGFLSNWQKKNWNQIQIDLFSIGHRRLGRIHWIDAEIYDHFQFISAHFADVRLFILLNRVCSETTASVNWRVSINLKWFGVWKRCANRLLVFVLVLVWNKASGAAISTCSFCLLLFSLLENRALICVCKRS